MESKFHVHLAGKRKLQNIFLFSINNKIKKPALEISEKNSSERDQDVCENIFSLMISPKNLKNLSAH